MSKHRNEINGAIVAVSMLPLCDNWCKELKILFNSHCQKECLGERRSGNRLCFTCWRPKIKSSYTDIIVFEMLKEDGSPWFLLSLDVQTRDYKNFSETMKMYFENPETSQVENKKFTGTIIPIVPNSWYHICMGIQGHQRIL